MKKIVALLCLVAGMVPGVSAQENDVDRLLREFQSPRWLLYQEAQERPTYRALWNGQGDWLATRIILNSAGDDALDLNEEQQQRLAFLHKPNEIARKLVQKKFAEGDPELLQANEAANRAFPADDPWLERATEEQERHFVAVNELLFQLPNRYMDQEVEETLTPEQKTMVQTFKLSMMSEMGLPVPSMFEPLGLTDEQRAQMEAVKEAMQQEFEQLLDDSMELRKEQLKGMVDLLTESVRDDKPKSSDELWKRMSESGKKAFENEALQKKFKQNAERGKKFATELKNRLMDVLTDEQLDKMQELIDNMPDFTKNLLDQMRGQRKAAEKEGKWMPGPDSWRPGDGVPEQFKKERQERRKFPGQK